MIKKLPYIILGVLFLCSTHAYAIDCREITLKKSIFFTPTIESGSPLLHSILSFIRSNGKFSSSFSQTKEIIVLQKPLQSKGTFRFEAGKGLEWHQIKPFEQTVHITKDILTKTSSEGEREEIVLKDIPIARGISEAFLALFSDDVSLIDTIFSLHLEGNEKEWRLGLQPKDDQMKRFLAGILLEGGKELHTIELCEVNGDRTIIELHTAFS